MTDLVPIKVRIGLRPNGHADHPDFNLLPPEVRDGGLDWSIYIDRFGIGWHYDKVCGHKETDAGNPDVPADHGHRCTEFGVQYACTLVPEPFALAAVAKFPGAVAIIDETSFESFYDDRAHAQEPDILRDADVLRAIRDQMALEADPLVTTPEPTLSEKRARTDALDPDVQSVRGVRKNLRRRWADAKVMVPGKIRADLAKP